MTATFHHDSLEYVRVAVSAKDQGESVDPTGDTVQFAFTIASEDPVTWNAGTWETDGSKFFARCLIGPGEVELYPRLWSVWVRITDNPEIPVIRAGGINVI